MPHQLQSGSNREHGAGMVLTSCDSTIFRTVGADGPGLFSDDTACDVRDAYREALEDGFSDSEAEVAVVRAFSDELTDPDESTVVWLALASTQSTLGRLSEATRRQAIRVLDAGGDLERWREAGPAHVRRRAAALEKVRAQIEGLQPARRHVRRRRRPTSSLSPGEVLAYRARSGRVYLMRVVALTDVRDHIQPAIRFLDYAGSEIPDPSVIGSLRDRRRHPRWKKVELRIVDDSPPVRDQAGIAVVGLHSGPTDADAHGPKAASLWSEVATYLETRDELGI